jgi:16S rRNA U1498 N3-methylase RsmE
MLENLNELEKIGLAFISGLVAGQSLQEAEQEVEQEANNNNEKEMTVAVGKIEGEKAEKFIKMMKELGVE